MTAKIRKFLQGRQPETPCLVVDLDVVSDRYAELSRALPGAEIFYAMKANPALEILSLLHALGSQFDTASIHEIEACLDLGIGPDRIAFGNTVKKSCDIARAHEYGHRLIAFASSAEMAPQATADAGAAVS